MPTKVCYRCKAEKEETEFYLRLRDGLDRRGICIPCCNELNKQWRADNKEKIATHNKEYRARDPEKTKRKRREQYLKHWDTVKQYRDDNKEKIKQWFLDHPEHVREYRSKYNWLYRMKMEYGLSPQEYDEMLMKQGGVCAICGKEEIEPYNSTVRIGRLCVDHNHETGELRGLLCMRCNRGIGLFRDDANILKRASEYLEEYGNN